MIRQILVYDPKLEIVERIQKIFSVFLRGYQVFHVNTVDEAMGILKSQMIDVVVINGDAFVKDPAGRDIEIFRRKIVPPPKILLILEENLVNTVPQYEGVVDGVFTLSGFRAVRFRRVIHNLVQKKFAAEWHKEQQELDDSKRESKRIKDELYQICDEMEKNPNEPRPPETGSSG